MTEFHDWESSLIDEIKFYKNSLPNKRNRKFIYFSKLFYYRLFIREIILFTLRKFGLIKLIDKFFNKRFGNYWFEENSYKIWDFRSKLNDYESIFYLDSVLILRETSIFQYFIRSLSSPYFLKLESERPFKEKSFPEKYINSPIFVSKVSFLGKKNFFKIISTKHFINNTNKFQQYFPIIKDKRFIPKKGQSVIDCGSCIGDTSILFAQFVGKDGKVFMIDPLKLHNNFAELQIKYNPKLQGVLIPCRYAVSNFTKKESNLINEVNKINPAFSNIYNSNKIRIDDFVKENNITNLGYIKMDIEGHEVDALKGSKAIIKKFKPKLAISAYHKFDDFWNISNLIKEILPEYQLFFRHHSPLSGESVIYAISEEELYSDL